VSIPLFGCGDPAVAPPECTSTNPCPTGFACVEEHCYQEIGEQCGDSDGDGFSAGPGCTGSMIDCDDTDATRYPGAPEVCGDGINQDCLAGPDLGCDCASEAGVGSTRDCNEGRCMGSQTCTDTGWGECLPSTIPLAENCGPDGMGDGVDDDCNGMVDDGCVACGARRDGMGDERVCNDEAGRPALCSSNGNCI